MTRGKKIVFFALAGALALTIGSWLGQALMRPPAEPSFSISGIFFPQSQALEDFTLIDQSGQPFHRQRFEGKWTFLYFGYTYCPDACPMTLAELSAVQKELAQQGLDQDTAYMLISVDPQRDTPEQLGKYTAYFNAKFQGATGSPQELSRLTRQVGMVYRIHAPTEENDPHYAVDHSSSIVLLDPDTRLRAIFTPPHEPEVLVADFVKIREYYQALH